MTSMPAQLDRREVLALALATAAAAALPGAARAAGESSSVPARRFAALLGNFAEEILRLDPRGATALGLDHGDRRALKSQLDDLSPAGDARWAAQVGSMLKRLSAIDTAKLAPLDLLRYETVKYAAAAGVEGTKFLCGKARFVFNSNGAAVYPVTQQDGSITSIPEFLDTQHQIADKADADAYLARVAALTHALDQESAEIAAQAARGVMPPSFIAATALGILTQYRRTPVAGQKLVTSLVRRTQAAGLKGDWEAQVTRLVQKQVYPALDRQIAAFAKATADAPDTAGVQRLPDGEGYYRWALKLGTTSEMSPQEIHAVGLEQNRAIQARMESILKAQGMTQGSVGERVQSLNRDPRQLYADTDAGRGQLIDYCNERIAANRALMPRLSHLRFAGTTARQARAGRHPGWRAARLHERRLDRRGTTGHLLHQSQVHARCGRSTRSRPSPRMRDCRVTPGRAPT